MVVVESCFVYVFQPKVTSRFVGTYPAFVRSSLPLCQRLQEQRKTRGAKWCGERKGSFGGGGWLYLELVIGAVHLLVVIDFKRLQELEVKGEAPLHPDAVVAAQVSGVGPGVLQAGDVARRLCVQRAAALSCGVRARGSPGSLGWSKLLPSPCLAPSRAHLSLPWQECPSV